MKNIKFNVLNKKDASNERLPQELELSNGTMLLLPVYDNDVKLKELMSKVQEVGIDNCDERTVNNYFDTISGIMPQIVVNLSNYIRPSLDNGIMVIIRRELFHHFYCVIHGMGDSNQLAIGWDIEDTCWAISGILIQKKSKCIMPINEKTHITAIDISLNEDSILGNTIVITPTIENLEID